MWDFHFELDGPRIYRPGETAAFELLVPLEATETNFTPPDGLLGDVAQALSFLSNVKRFPLEWKVYAFLDRPCQLNPKGEVQLQLRPREPTAPKPRSKKPAATPRPKSKKRSPSKKKSTKTKKRPT